jgi:putative DNA primase/helicase
MGQEPKAGSMRDTANQARGKWAGILPMLGVDPKFLKNIHGPCPHCGGKDRFRFDDDLNGNFYCSKCGAGDGFVLLQLIHGWDFKKAASEVDRIVGTVKESFTPQPKTDKAAYMRKLYRESFAVVPGDPVWLYLVNRCGDPTGMTEDLRYHPSLKHSVEGGTHPAMLAIMRGPDGKGCGIHRTYLTLDGHKANVDPVRMSYGELGPVRFGGVQDALGIAEGIETALCASKHFGIPVWAAISANGLETFEPGKSVKSVLICGDNDLSFTGQAAAYVLAKRLHNAGLKVAVSIPKQIGSDWADVQMGKVA